MQILNQLNWERFLEYPKILKIFEKIQIFSRADLVLVVLMQSKSINHVWVPTIKWSWKKTSAKYLELNRQMLSKEGNFEYFKKYQPYIDFQQ